MINLIPKEEKKKIIRNFYFKLLVLLLFVLTLVVLAAILAILPSYYLSFTKTDIIDQKLLIQDKEPTTEPDARSLEIVQDLNKKLQVIENAQKNQFRVSRDVVSAILAEKSTDIKILEISYEQSQNDDSLVDRKVSLKGLAPSREALLSFRQSLEEATAFKQVNLPISNFVRGSDIEFSLNLIPRPESGSEQDS